MDIITKKQAKSEGLKRYFTGKPCKRGHIAERTTSSGTCVMCELLWKRTGTGKAISNKATRTYRAVNKARLSVMERQYAKKRRDNLPGIVAETSARVRAGLAVVGWRNRKKVLDIYEQCYDLNLASATAGSTQRFVVDHIIPLNGEGVSGLHNEHNLQILTREQNSEKGNEYW